MAAEVVNFCDRTFEREIECKDGILTIKQAEVGDESCVVWDAALVLAKYLQTEHFCPKERLVNKRVVELGGGTGVVGLIAASCGALVCCTDLPEVVPLIELNRATNQHMITGTFTATSLKWGQDVSAFQPCPDLVLAADCIYYEEKSAASRDASGFSPFTPRSDKHVTSPYNINTLSNRQSLEPLVSTLCDLSNENTTVLISYEERTMGNKPLLEKKFHQLVKEHFTVEEIPEEEQDPVYHSPDIHLLKLKRKI